MPRGVSYDDDLDLEGDEPEPADNDAERNYQLIENLMSRLQKMESKAFERRRACEADQDATTDMCSSKVPSLQQDMDEKDGEERLSRKPSMFLSDDGSEINVTFRSAPATEAGKRLDVKFDDEVGHILTSAPKHANVGRARRGGVSGSSAARTRRTDQHKQDEKKQERIKFERRLQSNLEHYVTRAVGELRYVRPGDVARAVDDDDLHHHLAGVAVDGGDDAPERWPIPIMAQEMNPRLLLSYSCERIVLPSGGRMFKHFVVCQLSCHLYVYLYWYVHCRFFQDSSVEEQEHLLRHVATLYVKMLSLRSLEAHRDFFFKYYPYVLANAIFWGFYYLCPGSRHLYTNGFKKILYLQMAQIMTGMDVCPSSVQVLRQQVFPEEAADDDGEEQDSLPPLPMHGAANADKNLRNAQSATVIDGPADGKALAGSASAPAILPSGEAGGDDLLDDALVDGLVEEDALDASSQSLLAAKKKPGSSASLLGGRAPSKRGDTAGSRRSGLPRHPVACYTGGRDELRFRPPAPQNLQNVIPRQRKVSFNTSVTSPLLQQYLEQEPMMKRNSVIRTSPVHWCYTGGTETFVKTPSSREIHDGLQQAYRDAKLGYRRDCAELRRNFKRSLRHLDNEKTRIQSGGAVSIGRYALDRVVENMAASSTSAGDKGKGKPPRAKAI